MIEETITRRIEFCDVDLTGVMWHGNYCKYYEAARCQLLNKLGFSYNEIRRNNHQIPLVQLSIRYSKPCRYDQEITVTAKLVKYSPFLEFQYVIKDKASGQTLSKAETKHAFYNSITQKALFKPPEFIANKLKLIAEQ